MLNPKSHYFSWPCRASSAKSDGRASRRDAGVDRLDTAAPVPKFDTVAAGMTALLTDLLRKIRSGTARHAGDKYHLWSVHSSVHENVSRTDEDRAESTAFGRLCDRHACSKRNTNSNFRDTNGAT